MKCSFISFVSSFSKLEVEFPVELLLGLLGDLQPQDSLHAGPGVGHLQEDDDGEQEEEEEEEE